MSQIIQFEGVSKYYRIGAGRGNIRDAIMAIPSSILRRGKAVKEDNGHWALKDVSFEINAGSVLGIIGPNGAGKTTSLKILSRVTRPTQGVVRVNGRVSALIELGAGFHPELTGRENILLNGAILGMKQKEIVQRLDSIVAFAELEKFIDMPVKRYSSGMYARLGFAVAVHVDPDILLVDEVLSVGDMNFQRKCFDFIHSYVTSGHTAVFVSHNLYALEQLCDRIVWLDQGKVVAQGPAQEILTAYMKDQDRKLAEVGALQTSQDGMIQIERVYPSDSAGQLKSEFWSGEDICVNLEYRTSAPIAHPHFVLGVWDAAARQPIFLASMLVDNQSPTAISGQGRIVCQFQAPPLMPRTYLVWGEVYGSDRKKILIQWQPLCAFTILDEHREGSSISIRHQRADAPVRVPYSWTVVESGS